MRVNGEVRCVGCRETTKEFLVDIEEGEWMDIDLGCSSCRTISKYKLTVLSGKSYIAAANWGHNNLYEEKEVTDNTTAELPLRKDIKYDIGANTTYSITGDNK